MAFAYFCSLLSSVDVFFFVSVGFLDALLSHPIIEYNSNFKMSVRVYWSVCVYKLYNKWKQKSLEAEISMCWTVDGNSSAGILFVPMVCMVLNRNSFISCFP